MRKRFFSLFLALLMLSALAACGGSQGEPEPDDAETESQAVPLETTQKKSDTQEKKETYDEITALYADIIPDAEISATLRNGRTVHVKIKTDLPSDAEPDSWEETLTALGDALAAADEKKTIYGASVAAVEVLSPDESILASGFDGKVLFNKFAEPTAEEGSINPPTISRFEYDQISVGMTLSQVRKIVGGDGTLQDSIGEAGVISLVQTYRFLGEREGSYADILFDDYEVYSKFEFMLE